MLLALHLIVVLLFVILGLVFRSGRGAFLIAGYNTASKEKREETDEKKLCSFMSRLMDVLAGSWLIVAASEIVQWMPLLWIGMVLFLLATVCGVIYANTGDRFRR
jgi:preprotein translocase subunit SecG